MQLAPPDVETLFRPDARRRGRDGTPRVVEVLDAGTLQLATGRLVAVDPFLGVSLERDAVPFTATAAPGRYPVSLSTSRREQLKRPTTPSPVGPVAAVKLTIRSSYRRVGSTWWWTLPQS